MSDLVESYEDLVKNKKIEDDSDQRRVVASLQHLCEELHRPLPFFSFLQKKTVPQGIYLYGPVGRGKTWLMDLFYHALPADWCHRVHFHQFMQNIDTQLRQLQGKKNPIQWIAKRIALKVKVLCLDEFIVQDITQASMLAELLRGLFQRGVILVATSNTAPDLLYKDGVNRARFLPAIALIHEHCKIISLTGEKDYRLYHDILSPSYLTPLGQAAHEQLLKTFKAQEPHPQENSEICIQKRGIPYLYCGKHAIWFEFNELCNIPRCQLDYLELADKFSHFFVSNVPILKEEDSTAVLLLMYLVDVLYDRKSHLMISAAVPLEELYIKGPMLVEFERTKSRLTEMTGLGVQPT